MVRTAMAPVLILVGPPRRPFARQREIFAVDLFRPLTARALRPRAPSAQPLRATAADRCNPDGARLAVPITMALPDPDTVPITSIMTRATIATRGDATVESLITLMTENHVGCVPIVDDQRRPIGIVTKLDLIECRSDARATAREVMMPLAMSLPADATVARAAALLTAESFHHLLVVDTNRVLLGIVSTFDVTRWVASR